MLKVFSIYDSKAQIFTKPFFALTTQAALREFQVGVNNPNSVVAQFPADFTLFELGEFQEKDCSFKLYESKVNLGTALELAPADDSRMQRELFNKYGRNEAPESVRAQ